MLNNNLVIGKIIGSHGVRGEMKIFPLTDDSKRFNNLKKAFITDENDKIIRDVTCTGVKYVKNAAVVKFSEIADKDLSDSLKGNYVSVSRENAVKLTKNSYFICDLISSKVIDESGDLIGVLTDIINTGANDVYVVKRQSKKDLLLPAIKEIVKKVDVEEKVIVVELIQGLEEIYN